MLKASKTVLLPLDAETTGLIEQVRMASVSTRNAQALAKALEALEAKYTIRPVVMHDLNLKYPVPRGHAPDLDYGEDYKDASEYARYLRDNAAFKAEWRRKRDEAYEAREQARINWRIERAKEMDRARVEKPKEKAAIMAKYGDTQTPSQYSTIIHLIQVGAKEVLRKKKG